MKKIGIVIADITLPSGTERAVVNLSNLLSSNQDMKVYIISLYSKYGSACYYELNDNVEIIHLEQERTKLFNRLFIYIKVIKKINKLVCEKELNVLLGTTHAFNVLLCFIKKIKRIGCEHMSYYACPFYSRLVRKIFYKNLDKVVLLTKSDAKHYNFLRNEKVTVIPNSISFLCKNPSKLLNKSIICVGRLTYQKGFDLLLDVAYLVKQKLPDWKIQIFGEGELLADLQQKIQELGLTEYVIIHEPTKEIEKEFVNSSMFVLSSRFEGLPMVLLEAKVCGLPIVSFDCPEGPADVITNDIDGYLIEPGNIQEMAEKIVELGNDYDKRILFGKKAIKNVQAYSTENVTMLWNTMFKDLGL